MKAYQPMSGTEYDFQIYASEEYSRILAQQWQAH
jgi:hypothetical protein